MQSNFNFLLFAFLLRLGARYMNIVYLKYAVTVAKAGSLSKAQEQLFIAQPNLSRAIKELEKELNIVIFDRNTKGVTLTPDGERLISYGEKLLKEISYIEEQFKGEKTNKSVFSISVPRASYICSAFAEFSKELVKEEKCEVYYKETNNQRTLTNILEKGYKYGIIRYATAFDKYFKQTFESKNLAYEMITEFNYVLLVNKESPLTKIEKVKFSDLEPLIEIAHADPYAPSVSLSEIKKEELPDNISKRIFVFERASQFEVLSANTETFMWVSPVPQDILDRYGLVQLECEENKKVYKDVLIYQKNYKLTNLDKLFITKLCEAKRKYIK